MVITGVTLPAAVERSSLTDSADAGALKDAKLQTRTCKSHQRRLQMMIALMPVQPVRHALWAGKILQMHDMHAHKQQLKLSKIAKVLASLHEIAESLYTVLKYNYCNSDHVWYNRTIK